MLTMFKKLVYVIIAGSLALAGCKSEISHDEYAPPSVPAAPPAAGTDDAPAAVYDIPGSYAADFWGEWLCGLDGATWYVASGGINITDGPKPSGAVTLSKQSARVVKASEGGREYYLYASRIAGAAFTGRLATAGGAAYSAAGGPGFAAAGTAGFAAAAGVNVRVTSLDNPALAKTAVSGASGEFAVPGVIPGDRYKVEPDGGTAEIVTIENDGQDIGTITLARGVNFKTRSLPHDEHLYIHKDYTFTIEIENTGTENCTAATYALAWSDNLNVQDPNSRPILGTIMPGMKKTIPLTVSCGDIYDYESLEKIYITITGGIPEKTWTDSVSFMFKQKDITLNIAADQEINGVLIAPNARAQYFKGKNIELTTPASSKEYLIFFCGATIDSETCYSFGINCPAPDFQSFTALRNYEPENNGETSAPRVPGKEIISYLHVDDIDFYTFGLDKITKEITAFALAGQKGVIKNNGLDTGTIHVKVPHGTGLSNRTVELEHSGASISPFPGAPQNFTAPVIYTVSAENGAARTYEVTVETLPDTACEITAFSLGGANGVIAGANIAVTLPYGSSVASLSPNVAHSGASISPPPGAAQNFTHPLTYTVTAASGATKTYTVTVTVARNDSKSITSFTIEGQKGETAYNEAAGTITLSMPDGTPRTALTPAIAHSGTTVSPPSGAAQNFTGAVEYTVTADDGSTKTYTVTAAEAPPEAVTLNSVTADGGSWNAETTRLTLTFSKTMDNALKPEHIGLSVPGGIVKGTLTNKGGGVYELGVSNIPANGASVTVSQASRPAGYDISGSKTVTVWKAPAPLTWNTLTADGADGTTTTAKLTLTFSADMGNAFTASNITLGTGATKGALANKGGGTYELAVSAITGNKASVTVTLTNPTGWKLSSTSKQVAVYKKMITWSELKQVGGTDGAATTTALRFTFSADMGSDFTAANITLTPALTKGTVSRVSPGVYELAISGVTTNKASVTANITVPDGYGLSGAASKAVAVYKKTVTLNKVEQVGGTSNNVTTTALRLTFSADMGNAFTAANITLGSGATKGAVTPKGGGVYELAVSGVTTNGASVTVTVTVPSEWELSGGSPKTVTVYKKITTGLFKGATPDAATNLGVQTLVNGLAYIAQNAAANDNYFIVLAENESAAPQTLSYGGKTVNITLLGEDITRTVQLSAKGSLLTVGSGVTLTLDKNIKLAGRSDNDNSVVTVNSGGTLILNAGATISGNTKAGGPGGGVSVVYGTFTMSGGAISDNTAAYGGGVSIVEGTFTMSGGTISGNTARNGDGGGVDLSGYQDGCFFTMSGGTISGNTARDGGGVSIYDGTTFTMSGGTISGNTARDGGGVSLTGLDYATFFTMSGGAISGNTATDRGGGVFLTGYNDMVFFNKTNTGGVIYGHQDPSAALRNKANDDKKYEFYYDSGPAVYMLPWSGNKKHRNKTINANEAFSGATGPWD